MLPTRLTISAILLLLLSTAAPELISEDLQQAIQQQRQALRANPSDPNVHNDLANLLSLGGDPEEAIAEYEAALQIDPDHLTAHSNLALLYMRLDREAEARTHYQEVLRIDGANAWAYYQLGRIAEEQGDRRLAVSRYANAFALDRELLFAENNPHIIENGLITEALLRSPKKRRRIPSAPLTFHDADGIAWSMVGKEKVAPATESGDDAVATDAASDDEAAAPGSLPAPTSSAATPTTGTPATTTVTAAPGPAEARGDGDSNDSDTRVLDASNLSTGGGNQVERVETPQTELRRRTGGFGVSGQRQKLETSPRSTGNLDWRIVPDEDPDAVSVPAAL